MENNNLLFDNLSLELYRCGCSATCENLSCSCPTGQPLANGNHSNKNQNNAADVIKQVSVKTH